MPRSLFAFPALKTGLNISDHQSAILKGFSLFIFRKSDILSSLSRDHHPGKSE